MSYEIEEDERIILNGTVSHSDEDDHDEDDDDDDDESTTSWWDEFRSSWRQHCVAILIAVLATAFAFMHPYYLSPPNIFSSKYSGRRLATYHTMSDNASHIPPPLQSHHPHEFLERFERTANVSFCSAVDQKIFLSDFSTMDFHVPKDLVHTLALHFQIDLLQEDDVSTYVRSIGILKNTSGHDQIQCILRLKEYSPQDYIKGVTFFYKKPSIESMYHSAQEHQLERSTSDLNQPTKNSPLITETVLSFTGFAAKFVNMASTPILLYWDGRGGDDRHRRLVGEIAPFEALTTATRPGESFSVSPVYDHSLALDRWTVTADEAVQYYEPSRKTPFTQYEQVQYNFQKLNQEFAKHYLIHAGRTWLSHFPRAFPIHFMWNADYFGQRHEVEAISTKRESNVDDVSQKYTIEVASVTPRVFKIDNFLSQSECETLIQVAIQNGLEASSVYAGGERHGTKHHRDVSTRSSTNTWLTRDHHINLTDKIYRRAAQIMKMDEAAFGHNAPIDDSIDDAKYHSIAESLQVVRYKVGEEYTPHHDWVLPSQLNRYQPTRFATLLIYLNDDFEGGQTVFPRAVNRQYHEGIQIVPQKGTAILFYNLLPDGNVDDLSQHGSDKVTKGEKVSCSDSGNNASLLFVHRTNYFIYKVCRKFVGLGSSNQLESLVLISCMN